MKSFNIVVILATVFYLSSCSSEPKEQPVGTVEDTITISGAFALYPLAVRWGEEYQKKYPKIKVIVTSGGAGKGISEVLQDKVDLGMASRDIVEAEIKQGAWEITVARDAVLPTISASNPYYELLLKRGVTKDEFYKIWVSGEIKTWGDLLHNNSKEPIHQYKRSDGAGAGETWAKFLGKTQHDLLGKGVAGDLGLAHAVTQDPLSTGFNNIAYIYDLRTQQPYTGLAVIPIDLDGNGQIDSTENFYQSHQTLVEAIIAKKIPTPPARELCFVAHGPPKEALLRNFFEWVLTDGQKYISEMGYIRLSHFKTEAEVEILENYEQPKEEKQR